MGGYGGWVKEIRRQPTYYKFVEKIYSASRLESNKERSSSPHPKLLHHNEWRHKMISRKISYRKTGIVILFAAGILYTFYCSYSKKNTLNIETENIEKRKSRNNVNTGG